MGSEGGGITDYTDCTDFFEGGISALLRDITVGRMI